MSDYPAEFEKLYKGGATKCNGSSRKEAAYKVYVRMKKLGPNSLGSIINRIQTKVNTNVIVQVQSYGRVFVYDQLGEIVSQDDAICVNREEGESTDAMMLRAVKTLEERIA